MGYKKWNKETLNEQIKYVTKKLYETPSRELAATLNTLEDLKNNKPSIFSPENNFEEQISYDKSLLKEQIQFLPDIEKFAKLDDNYHEKINGNLTIRTIPNRILLSYVHDFYNSIDRDFAKYFNKVFKERKRNLRLSTNNATGYNRNYMNYLYTINYAYINIHIEHTIEDFFNIIHEYAHAIADQMYYRHRYGKYPFIELLPLLMEEIAYDEVINTFEDMDDDVLIVNAVSTKTVLKYAKELILQKDYLSVVDKSLERKQFVNNLAEYSHNTKTKIEKILNTTIQEKISYIIPYIVMIELYDMYYDDPEKALYTTKKIVTMDEVDDYISYLNNLGINLNEHTEIYVEDQRQKIKTYTDNV